MRTPLGHPATGRTCGRWAGVAVAAGLLFTGCTHVPKAGFDGGWNPVPALTRQPPASPKVSANAGSEQPSPPELTISEVESAAPATSDPVVAPIKHDHADRVASAVEPASESRIQRLRQALSADARRSADRPQETDDPTTLRQRIDALLRMSSQQRDEGEIDDARVTAQHAAELAEEGQISFLPTEVRPSDLLRQLSDDVERPATDTPPTLVTTEHADPFQERLPGPLLVFPPTQTSASPVVDIGQVAANRPMRLAQRPQRSDERDLPMVAEIALPNDEETSKTSPVAGRISSRDALLSSRTRGADPVLELPDSAPDLPMVDPLKPLPKLRSRERPTQAIPISQMDAIPLPGVGLRGWSLWGPTLSLAAILGVLGLALAGRSYLFWRRTAKS